MSDFDQDGISNAIDLCPNISETYNGFQDDDGCPDSVDTIELFTYQLADIDNLIFMKRTADRLFGNDYRWSVLGAGGSQIPFATTASQMGGNVRVGLEDSLLISRGKLAKNNAQQVAKIRRIVEELGNEVATPDEAREILALKGGDRVKF